MAAETGISSVYLDHQLSHGRASKKSRGSIIERLRHKNSQIRSWNDSIKSVWSFIAERKAQTDKAEASSVQQCLDTLQKAMKVTSQEILKERLDLIGRQLGLNIVIQDQNISLGTDVFHVEVLLEDGGAITNVKLANQEDVADCPDLRDILIKGDFTEFTEHLQGLQSIYQVTTDEKLKSKAFLALQALEKDLNQLAQFQSSISGVANYIHKCPLGIMLPRLAGKPMKLIYFVSPYDLLDKKSLTAHPLTVEAITENFLGQSVTVCIESVPDESPGNKLQTMPLMNVSKTQDGKSLPSFSAVSKINSMTLPASFVLVLPQSIPVSVQILQKITSQTGLEIHKEADPQSLRSLILEAFSGGKISDCTKLFVSLPDQQHMYFLDGLNGRSPDQLGVMVCRIPFTHPTHVPQILNLMRQQLLFNIIMASCIRQGAKKDPDSSIVFEVTVVSLQQLTVVLEHPAYDCMITVDVDLSDITNLKCRVSCVNSDHELCSDEAISRVFQRCMSIPIMLRWLIGKGRGHLDKLKEAALIAERERLEKALFLKEMQHRQAKLQPTTLPANRPPPQPPHPPPLPPPPSYSHHHLSPMHISQGQLSGNGQTIALHPMLAEVRNVLPGLEEFRQVTESNNKHPNERLLMSIDDDQVHNPLLSTLLDEEKLHDSPMLSRLLDDNTSVATTVIPMNCRVASSVSVKRQRKRRLPSDFSGPSPKHRVSDIDTTDHLGLLGSSVDLDMGPALMDQSLANNLVTGSMTPTHGSSGYHHHPLLNHVPKIARPQSSVIDLTEGGLMGESSLKKLADSVDKHFIHKDVKTEPDLSMLLNEAETPNRIPNILQNSPGSKNENASTSLEGFLKGSGEVGRAKDFDPSDASSVHCSTTFSKLSSLLLASSDSPTSNLGISSHKTNSTFYSDKIGSEETFGAGVGKTVSDVGAFSHDVKPSPASLRKGTLRHSSSVEIPNDKQITSGLFEKFDLPRQQHIVKMEAANAEVKSQPVEGKVSLKLRVGPFKQHNSVKQYVKSFNSVDESDLDYGKSNSIGTFDFKSDDDDDQLLQFPSDRYVYSSSPTCLQISCKQKRLNDYVSVPQKSDKTKKKDKSSGNITKRKREKDESKREKKRKKNEHFIQESVYRTVENDTKANFKLKIRVAKKPVTEKSDTLSEGKVQSYEIKKRSLSSSGDKPLAGKQEPKEPEHVVSETKEKDTVIEGSNASRTVISKLATTTIHKSLPKSGSSKTAQGSGSTSKTDPKLVTKATIRLKPLMIPNSSSTVNIGQSGPKVSNSVSGVNKSDRRCSTSIPAPTSDNKRLAAHNSLLERRRSLSNLMDRRGVTHSSSQLPISSAVATAAAAPTTSASANLSLSSILPNAPTISKIASLPRIPKLSSSSSNTSINRTSSLDPASGSIPTSAGTKSNNSYTVGPAGRPSQGALSGPGGRFSGVISGSFNYTSRPTTPNTGGTGSNRSNFSANRTSGLAQGCSLANSSPSGSQKVSGLRAHTPSVGGNSHRTGLNSANSHKPSSNSASNSLKGTIGISSSPNVTLKTYGSSVKISNSISSKIGNNLKGQKSVPGSGNTISGQRHTTQNAHSVNSTRPIISSSGVCKSPNTPGLAKSPNSGKSPNITNSSRSPNLNSANKSPNITAANKSPNTSSSNSGRSPSINSSKSPNISNSSVRPTFSPSHSGKSPISVSQRHSTSVSKSSGVNKTTSVIGLTKSHSLSPSQRSYNSISGNNKCCPTKTGTKSTVIPSSSSSSNNQRLGNGKPVSTTSQHSISTNNKMSISATSISSSPSLSNLESLFVPNFPAQNSSAAEQQITSASSFDATISTSLLSSSPPLIQQSPVKLDNNDHTELSQDYKGSKVQATVTEDSKSVLSEKFPVSTPGAAQSTDSMKSVFNFPSCRGRKNSLSAIVDKLKNNAVGGVSESPGVLPDSPSGVSNKTSQTSELTSAALCVDSRKQEENTNCSLLAVSVLNADRIDKKENHLLEDNFVKAVSGSNSSESTVNSINLSCAKSSQSGTSDILLNAVNCDQSKMVDGRSQDLSCLADAGTHLTRLKDNSVSNKEKPDSIKVIEKPLKLSLSQQSPAINSCNTSISPQASPFQPLHSPEVLNNISPLLLPNVNTCKSLKDSNEQVFKMPAGDHQDSESKSSEMLEVSPEPVTDKSDNVCSSVIRDNHVRSVFDEKESFISGVEMSSSKPLSSPLSDISSPENGLIIDDESVHLTSKLSTDKMSGNNSVTKPQSVKSPIGDTNNSSSIQPSGNISVSSPHVMDSTPGTASPKTSWPHFVKSPLSKSSSGASAPKEADSPCPIDDDLMDMALGFGS